MKLPTREEILLAGAMYEDDGPQPMAAVVDNDRMLPPMLREMAAVIPDYADRYFILKCGLVLGLNIGIRIGENRRK